MSGSKSHSLRQGLDFGDLLVEQRTKLVHNSAEHKVSLNPAKPGYPIFIRNSLLYEISKIKIRIYSTVY